jgi:hypothetical protein
MLEPVSVSVRESTLEGFIGRMLCEAATVPYRWRASFYEETRAWIQEGVPALCDNGDQVDDLYSEIEFAGLSGSEKRT